MEKLYMKDTNNCSLCVSNHIIICKRKYHDWA